MSPESFCLHQQCISHKNTKEWSRILKAQETLVGQGLLIIEATLRKNDQLDVETST